MRVRSSFLPLPSPSAMSWLMPPPRALSTAPVAPPGRVTPSNRLTMMALAGCWAMSPVSTRISIGLSFGTALGDAGSSYPAGAAPVKTGALPRGCPLARILASPVSESALFLGLAAFWKRLTAPFSRRDLMEALLVGIAFLLYFAVRGAVVDRPEAAYFHALDVIDIQRQPGIFWEDDMNAWIKDRQFWAQTANIVYFWLHFPLIIAFGIYLYYGQRHKYTLMRDAFLTSGAIALVVYWLYPVAPPRELPHLARLFDSGGPEYIRGFFDTMQEYLGYGYQAQSTKAFVNPYAAMPSLHFGWDLLLGGRIVCVP